MEEFSYDKLWEHATPFRMVELSDKLWELAKRFPQDWEAKVQRLLTYQKQLLGTEKDLLPDPNFARNQAFLTRAHRSQGWSRFNSFVANMGPNLLLYQTLQNAAKQLFSGSKFTFRAYPIPPLKRKTVSAYNRYIQSIHEWDPERDDFRKGTNRKNVKLYNSPVIEGENVWSIPGRVKVFSGKYFLSSWIEVALTVNFLEKTLLRFPRVPLQRARSGGGGFV